MNQDERRRWDEEKKALASAISDSISGEVPDAKVETDMAGTSIHILSDDRSIATVDVCFDDIVIRKTGFFSLYNMDTGKYQATHVRLRRHKDGTYNIPLVVQHVVSEYRNDQISFDDMMSKSSRRS
jgi:hypothetical protein